MKKKLLYMGIALVSTAALSSDEIFNVTVKLLAPIAIIEDSPLVFPNTQSGSASNVVVGTGDAGAASFHATGSPSVAFTKSVVESSIVMELSGGSSGDATKEIVVDTFVLAGPSAFDGSGAASGLKVGGTARILDNDVAGDYSGTATFRMIY